MSSNQFLIFSDESGCWKPDPNGNSENYYIRAWIRLKEEDLKPLNQLIEKIFNELKENNSKNIEELRWKYMKNDVLLKSLDETNLKELFDINFQTFITISVPSCAIERIRETNTYSIINKIDEKLLTGYISTSRYKNDNNLAEITRDKLIKTVEHMLFMGIYEKCHIENAKKAFDLCETVDYEFIIDKPQCDKEMWKDIANIKNVELKDSKDSPGIQLADVIAGCYQDLLKDRESDEYKKAFEFYEKYLKSKQVYKGKELPNPNLIFVYDQCNKFVLDLIKRNIWQT